ncbi:MAG: hypothetical protein M1820_010043 [Bogoriella megaspora]|nr:MAG: hypothetical protein M1820_010043 [Bogoriella megaspora]
MVVAERLNRIFSNITNKEISDWLGRNRNLVESAPVDGLPNAVLSSAEVELNGQDGRKLTTEQALTSVGDVQAGSSSRIIRDTTEVMPKLTDQKENHGDVFLLSGMRRSAIEDVTGTLTGTHTQLVFAAHDLCSSTPCPTCADVGDGMEDSLPVASPAQTYSKPSPGTHDSIAAPIRQLFEVDDTVPLSLEANATIEAEMGLRQHSTAPALMTREMVSSDYDIDGGGASNATLPRVKTEHEARGDAGINGWNVIPRLLRSLTFPLSWIGFSGR